MLSCTHLRISFPPVFLREAPSTATPRTASQHASHLALLNRQLLLSFSLKPSLELGMLLLCDNIWALCFTRQLLLSGATLALHLACLLNSHTTAALLLDTKGCPQTPPAILCHTSPCLAFYYLSSPTCSCSYLQSSSGSSSCPKHTPLPSSTKHNTQQQLKGKTEHYVNDATPLQVPLRLSI